MAKRPKFSRWRRLPSVYRFGDNKAPDPGQDPTRLTIYPPADLLDRAESQAARLGFETVQDYCAALLAQGVEHERIKEQVAELEAKRGTLEGLHQVADDPDFLREMSAAAGMPPRNLADENAEPTPSISVRLNGLLPPQETADPASVTQASQTIFRHAGHDPADPLAFLNCLRRGDTVPQEEVAELAQALHDLEAAIRSSRTLDRRLVFALHRLAFESQVLHTDLWPGAFDTWTVDVLRAVQEAVDRILSGQDIRYDNADDPTRGGGPA